MAEKLCPAGGGAIFNILFLAPDPTLFCQIPPLPPKCQTDSYTASMLQAALLNWSTGLAKRRCRLFFDIYQLNRSRRQSRLTPDGSTKPFGLLSTLRKCKYLDQASQLIRPNDCSCVDAPLHLVRFPRWPQNAVV